MSEVIIRHATFEDAAEIANVHINSWREAYKDLMPQSFLDERPLNFKNRYTLWKRITVDPKNVTFVAESSDHGIVGFINGSAPRDSQYAEHVEIYSFYLLKKYQKKGIGFRLLNIYFEHFKNLGAQKAYLWVLEDNPTINFYKRTGGVFNGHVKTDTIAGLEMREHCFEWSSLDLGPA